MKDSRKSGKVLTKTRVMWYSKSLKTRYQRGRHPNTIKALALNRTNLTLLVCPIYDGSRRAYDQIHYWMKREHGKATRCHYQLCDIPSPTRFEWANISGEYSSDVGDWTHLCRSCHAYFDTCTFEERDNMLLRLDKLELTML